MCNWTAHSAGSCLSSWHSFSRLRNSLVLYNQHFHRDSPLVCISTNRVHSISVTFILVLFFSSVCMPQGISVFDIFRLKSCVVVRSARRSLCPATHGARYPVWQSLVFQLQQQTLLKDLTISVSCLPASHGTAHSLWFPAIKLPSAPAVLTVTSGRYSNPSVYELNSSEAFLRRKLVKLKLISHYFPR
jgi:hypothetical protein